nr:MAG TPA: hypothetical protein [Caudoviricetes sp.]DAX84846.1 MAG TPA: hypothetical protein [Caudoviricetes sp.]
MLCIGQQDRPTSRTPGRPLRAAEVSSSHNAQTRRPGVTPWSAF